MNTTFFDQKENGCFGTALANYFLAKNQENLAKTVHKKYYSNKRGNGDYSIKSTSIASETERITDQKYTAQLHLYTSKEKVNTTELPQIIIINNEVLKKHLGTYDATKKYTPHAILQLNNETYVNKGIIEKYPKEAISLKGIIEIIEKQ
jgi:hypothetical protein